MPEPARKPVLLLIRDGWGINDDPELQRWNATKLAQTPVSDRLSQDWPRTNLAAAGRDVGLPQGIIGNSEVGHQNIGAGRIVDQELVRIDKGMAEGRMLENPALRAAFECGRQRRLHLMGLVSDAGVHSMMEHLFDLLRLARQANLEEVFIHAFTDGRDTAPKSGLEFIRKVEASCREIGVGRIASVCGRFWAMDRDKRWDRVERAYRMLTGEEAEKASSAEEAIQHYYDNPLDSSREGDEFVEPTWVVDEEGRPIAFLEDGDSVLFFNFRGDRPRELTYALTRTEFDGFERSRKPELHFTTMTNYEKGLCPNVLFDKPPKMENILGQFVSGQGIAQFRCAETEKFPHVTFFFNDYREEPFPMEERCLIPSPKVSTYDLQPEMSAPGVTDAAVAAIKSGKYGLIVVNLANPDMVGHTGNLDATIRACEATDLAVGRLLEAVDSAGGRAVVTSDHGNSDQMFDPRTNSVHTAHTLNPVELIVYGRDCGKLELRTEGNRLADIAPTILDLMKLPTPREITGKSLIRNSIP